MQGLQNHKIRAGHQPVYVLTILFPCLEVRGQTNYAQTPHHNSHIKGKGKTSSNHARDVVGDNNCSMEIGGQYDIK